MDENDPEFLNSEEFKAEKRRYITEILSFWGIFLTIAGVILCWIAKSLSMFVPIGVMMGALVLIAWITAPQAAKQILIQKWTEEQWRQARKEKKG